MKHKVTLGKRDIEFIVQTLGSAWADAPRPHKGPINTVLKEFFGITAEGAFKRAEKAYTSAEDTAERKWTLAGTALIDEVSAIVGRYTFIETYACIRYPPSTRIFCGQRAFMLNPIPQSKPNHRTTTRDKNAL
jgi:hypothetical protein